VQQYGGLRRVEETPSIAMLQEVFSCLGLAESQERPGDSRGRMSS
jgi:hypothetical protein